MMERETIDYMLAYLDATGLSRLELTSPAPDINPHFRYAVQAAHARGVQIAMRCMLAALGQEPEDLAEFLAACKVRLIGWLLESELDGDAMRGNVRMIERLNRFGYGKPGSDLRLDLIYNPWAFSGKVCRTTLEADVRRHLWSRYGLMFNQLLATVNGPVQRLGRTLITDAGFKTCLGELKSGHCSVKLESVICRSVMNVDPSGYVYDCEFNQILGLPLRIAGKARAHLSEFEGADLTGQPIAVADHCYGCTTRYAGNSDVDCDSGQRQ